MSELERICSDLQQSLNQIGPVRERLLDAARRMRRLAAEVHGMVDASGQAVAQRIAAELETGAKRCADAAEALNGAHRAGTEWVARSCGGGGGGGGTGGQLAPIAFSAGGPRVRPGRDIPVDGEGHVDPPTAGQLRSLDVQGLSVYDSVEDMRREGLNGQVRAPSGPLPDGVGIISDGEEVGGFRPRGHKTIYPTRRMPVAAFESLIRGMRWENIGIKLK